MLIARVRDDELVVEAVAGDTAALVVAEGERLGLHDSLLGRPLSRATTIVVPDTVADRSARRLTLDRGMPVRSYLGVALRASDGRTLGVMFALNRTPLPGLGLRDARFFSVCAALVADQLEYHTRTARAYVQQSLQRFLRGDGVDVAWQPIIDLRDGMTLGVEALARFESRPPRPPDLWFAEAAEAGLGVDLERVVLAAAAHQRHDLPRGAYLSLNVTPEALTHDIVAWLIDTIPSEELVIEVTEHVAVTDYVDLRAALADVRERGVRLAVDDAGAGWSSLRHILRLSPDVIKLDASLTNQVGSEQVHDALVQALVTFSADVGADLIAEAIETPSTLDGLRSIGVWAGQGYLFAAPGRPEDLRSRYPVATRSPRDDPSPP